MNIDPQTGLLDIARQCPSPNHDERPQGCVADLIVLHNISLPPYEFGGGWIDQLFTNQLDPSAHPFFAEICHLRVASHLLITREGEIVQYVQRSSGGRFMRGYRVIRAGNAAMIFPLGLSLRVRILPRLLTFNTSSLKLCCLCWWQRIQR